MGIDTYALDVLTFTVVGCSELFPYREISASIGALEVTSTRSTELLNFPCIGTFEVLNSPCLVSTP